MEFLRKHENGFELSSHNCTFSVPPIPNVYTLHSWMGLLTVSLFAAQWISGLVSFLFPGVSKYAHQNFFVFNN